MKTSKKPTETAVVLHDIRSVYNVGSIFRTADAAGVSKIFLCGLTPTPLDRFGRPRQDLVKVALGAERNVPWCRGASCLAILRKLKNEGFQVIALEQIKGSVDYKKVRAAKRVALVVGNEVTGLSPALLREADVIAEIPMRGKKESLNVSVALAIALFRILNL